MCALAGDNDRIGTGADDGVGTGMCCFCCIVSYGDGFFNASDGKRFCVHRLVMVITTACTNSNSNDSIYGDSNVVLRCIR